MTDKLVLKTFSSLQQDSSATADLNSNSASIVTAVNNTLSRDGTSPNQMGGNLDMNSNQILNLPSPAGINSPARLQDVTNNPVILTVPPVGTSGATVPLLNANNTWSGTNTYSAASIDNGAVTFNGSATFNSTVSLPVNSIANTTLAQMPLNTIKGNNTGGTANAADLTVSQVNTMLGTALLAGNNTWTGNNFFKQLPWADVQAWGALGNGVHDDTANIQAAIDYMYTTYGSGILGGGIVYVPPGNYSVTGITLKGTVRLVGAARERSIINGGATNNDTVTFDSTSNYASLEHLEVIGYQNAAATSNGVVIAQGRAVNLFNCHILGGSAGLFTKGTDGMVENCYIAGYTSNITSNGANWYVRCKIDTAALGTPTDGFIQGAFYTSGVAENHFTDCDFSGNFTHSITINDTGTSSAITTFVGCVFAAPMVITNAKFTMMSACEVGSTVTVGTNPTAITGCVATGSAVVVSGGGKTLAGNISIT